MLNNQDSQRGIITNRARFSQAIQFKDMRFGNITPTDVDCAMEFDNRLFIFIEAKFIGTPMKTGQLKFLGRLADNMNNPPNRFGVSIIADHVTPSDQDVHLASSIVRSVRMNGMWRDPMVNGLTLMQAVRRMVAYVENKQRRPLYARESSRAAS